MSLKLSQGFLPEGDWEVNVPAVGDVMTEARGWNDVKRRLLEAARATGSRFFPKPSRRSSALLTLWW